MLQRMTAFCFSGNICRFNRPDLIALLTLAFGLDFIGQDNFGGSS